MRVPDSCLASLRERGYLLFEGFLEADELAAAREALWLHYPRPEVYFADPAAHAWLATDQWAGEVSGPWRSWNLNRLAFHPDLLDLAERFLGSADLRLDITSYLPEGMFAEEEVSMTGPAGTLFAFRSDVLHRGSRMTGERSARFALLADYDVWAPRWTGRVAWAERATRSEWFEIIERASPRERSVFGFLARGDPYWDQQTLADTQTRYPRADLTPYR